MKFVSIVSPCYNEEGNVEILTERVRQIFAELPQYRYEHIIIDNDSTDRSVDILRGIARNDPHVKIIVNARNFGHIRSPQHAFLEAKGDAVIVLLSDLQDPPRNHRRICRINPHYRPEPSPGHRKRTHQLLAPNRYCSKRRWEKPARSAWANTDSVRR